VTVVIRDQRHDVAPDAAQRDLFDRPGRRVENGETCRLAGAHLIESTAALHERPGRRPGIPKTGLALAADGIEHGDAVHERHVDFLPGPSVDDPVEHLVDLTDTPEFPGFG